MPTKFGRARQKAVPAKGLHVKEKADRIREGTPGHGTPETEIRVQVKDVPSCTNDI